MIFLLFQCVDVSATGLYVVGDFGDIHTDGDCGTTYVNMWHLDIRDDPHDVGDDAVWANNRAARRSPVSVY